MFSKTRIRRAGKLGVQLVQLLAACHLFKSVMLVYKSVAPLILLPFSEYVLEIRQTQGLSMMPTFAPAGNWVVVENLTRQLSFLRSMQRNDVVTFIAPQTLTPACKRIIGLPGDVVLLQQDDPESAGIRIPPGHVWLEGDNKRVSRDSRDYGPVPIALLRGRVVAQLWPDQRSMYPASTYNALETRTGNHSSVQLV